jgi:hypothetical protein
MALMTSENVFRELLDIKKEKKSSGLCCPRQKSSLTLLSVKFIMVDLSELATRIG